MNQVASGSWTTLHGIGDRLRNYWPMFKSPQTALLLFTGMAGYASARCPATTWPTFLSLSGSLLLAIAGSTVLNMVFDRDLDARMERTRARPLPSGRVSAKEAQILGFTLSAAGVTWALALSPLFGAVVLAGLLFDVVIYTMWLKRRTAWSIIWGGIAGGMPVLAGRALAVGWIDWVGIAMAMTVLLWIPIHIMTFGIRRADDYARAGIPTFYSTYGGPAARAIIAVSSMTAALTMLFAAFGIGLDWGYLRLLVVLGAGLVGLAAWSLWRPSEGANFGLFKYASAYMLSSMAMVLGGSF